MYVQCLLLVLLFEVLVQVMHLADLFVHDLDIIIESFLFLFVQDVETVIFDLQLYLI